MTKLESADLLIKQEGCCLSPINIKCKDCFNKSNRFNGKGCSFHNALNFAIKYKKEHPNG